MRVIALIEDPAVIERILSWLGLWDPPQVALRSLPLPLRGSGRSSSVKLSGTPFAIRPLRESLAAASLRHGHETRRSPPQRALIIIAAAILATGLAWPWLSKLWLGRLPGDTRIETESGGFYFPLMTRLIISIVLSVILWVIRRSKNGALPQCSGFGNACSVSAMTQAASGCLGLGLSSTLIHPDSRRSNAL
jgi:Protein of unknown function (DUF2905)